jgi:hypothetical protein
VRGADLVRGTPCVGGILIDRKAGRARSRHACEPGAVGGVKRRNDIADNWLDVRGRRFKVVGAGGKRLDPFLRDPPSSGQAVDSITTSVAPIRSSP